MRIYDHENKSSLMSILIMLTPREIHELVGKLQSLDMANDHIHLGDEHYKREITIGYYTPQNLQNFSDEVIRLIQEDE
jgi:hypothetical protein